MSAGFQPPVEPIPSYSVPEGTACRTCARLKLKVISEYPHPRMYIDCNFEDRKYMPRWECEFYLREPGTD